MAAMAATTIVQSFHGPSPGTPSDVTDDTVRFKRADNDTQDTSDEIPRPDSGFNYSWRKSFKLAATVGPDNKISNLRFFSFLQSLGTDREIFVLFPTTYTQGSVSDESTAISTDNVDNYTTASPKAIEGGQVLGPGDTGTGTQVFVVLQARVGPTAQPGNVTNAKQFAYRYDES